mmetsp:Transcript_15535/g.33141  ORF Transcript_15535/g.33141 Transcript_15535/m.33141 type:complete len:81 (+) Transcript_15535:340-582(+)
MRPLLRSTAQIPLTYSVLESSSKWRQSSDIGLFVRAVNDLCLEDSGLDLAAVAGLALDLAFLPLPLSAGLGNVKSDSSLV